MSKYLFSWEKKFFKLYNINKIINNKDIEIFIIIYFNIINISNLFSYYFKFKIDIFIILLYNFNIFIKLFNEIYLHFIHAMIVIIIEMRIWLL